MKLYEFEGKQLLREAGISTPQGTCVKVDETPTISTPCVVKPQTLAGGRGKSGFIWFCDTELEVSDALDNSLGKNILGEDVATVLIENKEEIAKEHYMGLIFCQDHRGPMLILSTKGGMEIEDIEKHHPESILKREIDIRKGISREDAQKLVSEAGFKEEEAEDVAEVLDNLYTSFVEHDMRMVEINPLVRTTQGSLVAVDAVVVLDDSSTFRATHSFPERLGIGRPLTNDEQAAHRIDEEDHRGVAGKTYIEMDGDIGIIASGGGASMTSMDALIGYGGSPANFTEFSGNAPAEKVEKLARIVLSQKGLNGLWIVGGTANFTQIDVTMGAIIKVLRELQPTFPIVVRRGGPGEDAAFEELEHASKTHNLDIHCYRDTVPMTETAEILVKLVEEFKNGNSHK